MKYFYLILAVVCISACGIFKGNKAKTTVLWINSETAVCNAESPLKCLQVQTGKELGKTWTVLQQSIAGFNYEPGYIYQVEVQKTKYTKEEIKEGHPSSSYILVKIMSKTPDLKEDGLYVQISTSKGEIVGKLAYKEAPLTVANFVGLAEGTHQNSAKPIGTPYYDSLVFHRVIPNFMIQGGDPTGTGSGGPGYKFKNETKTGLKHDKPGVFSMANSGPNTNGSQFFITHKATPWLDGSYNIFGHVIMGQNIITNIAAVPKNGANKPNTPIYMTQVRIIRIGTEAKKFDAETTFNTLK